MSNGNKTKEKIFLTAVKLFADEGYATVSVKTLASAVGIQAASIYSHYESKEAILDSIYDFYTEHCFGSRLSLEEFEPILRQGTVEKILECLNYPLAEPKDVMFSATRILWARIYVDEKAKKIYQEYVIDNSITYITQVLTRLCELGRLDMSQQEQLTFAMTILSSRIFSASRVVVDPDQAKWRIIETDMVNMFAKVLNLGPPVE